MSFQKFQSVARTLDRSEMLGVLGGSGSCAFITKDRYVFGGGVSKREAMSAGRGGHWCCDSCSHASWLSDTQKKYLESLRSSSSSVSLPVSSGAVALP